MPSLLDDSRMKAIFVCFYYIMAILVAVLVFVTFSLCKKSEPFADFEKIPLYADVELKVIKCEKAISALYPRVCAMDKFVNGGVSADFETVLNLGLKTTTKAEFEKDRPARQETARKQTEEQRSTSVGVLCNGKNPILECFENPVDWLEIEKKIKVIDTKIKLMGTILFKWVSPTMRGFAKRGKIQGITEGFANMSTSGFRAIIDTCSSVDKSDAPLVLQEIPDEYKITLLKRIIRLESYIPEIQAELDICELIKKKMDEKRERLERGEINNDDLAMGEAESAKITG
jgi:hypothetical protein